MGRSGGGRQNAGTNWSGVTYWAFAGPGTAESYFSDTAAGSEELNQTLLVSLVHFWAESTD